MPLNNSFYGVYKFVTVRTKPISTNVTGLNPYVIKSLNANDTMKANATFFMQGTPETKVLDIANVSQSIIIEAPILIAPENEPAIVDGLQLIWDLANLQYVNGLPNNSLPLLESAKIKIGSTESSVSLVLKSDGDPNNTTNVFEINSGATAQSYIATTNLNNGARVAKNYDFYINIGGFCFFVESADIEIKINSTEKNFLGVYQGNTLLPTNYTVPQDGLNNGVYTDGDPSYSGWQFPFIAVGGIEITATGKAVISIDANGDFINYNNVQAPQTTVDNLLAASNVTLQYSGELTTTASNFNVFYAGNANLSDVLPPIFATNKAVITTRNSNFSADVMTTDFTVKAFVGV
jgi:hypothetical protein